MNIINFISSLFLCKKHNSFLHSCVHNHIYMGIKYYSKVWGIDHPGRFRQAGGKRSPSSASILQDHVSPYLLNHIEIIVFKT